ncbi:hypothetical protein LFL97_32585 [Burkholderia sp. JSH-S8]|nr:hypothetical protein LFL97_32585 [Burkholderia sp. JSH-S8]
MTVLLLIGHALAAEQFGIGAREADALEKKLVDEAINSEIARQLGKIDSKSVLNEVGLASEPPKIQEDDWTISVDQIVIENDDVTGHGYEEILRLYQGRRLAKSALLELIGKLNNYYASLGYVTTLVSLPEKQSTRSGMLVLRVNWGRVAGFLINSHAPSSLRDKVSLMSAMPGISGQILNMAMVDQIVENLSTPLKRVKIVIVPAEAAGYSYLNLIIENGEMLGFSVSADNSGRAREDGVYKFGLQGSISDLLGSNDILSIGAGYRFFDHRDGSAENNFYGSYVVPIGYWSGSLSYSVFNTRRLYKGYYGVYHNKGSLAEWKGRLSRVISRGEKGKTFGWIEIGRRKNSDFFENELVEVSSKTYTQLTVGLGRVMSLLGGGAYADISWSTGVPWLSGDKPPSGPLGPSAKYNVFSSNVSWRRIALNEPMPVIFSLKAAAQYSEDRLLGKNKFLIGDPYTVRGFSDYPVSGDKGAYLSGTIETQIKNSPFATRLMPRVGLDVGFTKDNANHSSWGILFSGVIGVSVEVGRATLLATMGFPLASRGVENSRGPVAYADATYKF